MSIIPLIGIDPGLVHTGAVALLVDPVTQDMSVEYEVIDGLDHEAIREFIDRYPQQSSRFYAEAYRNRSTGFSQNALMQQVEGVLWKNFPEVSLINNTGFKKVVTKELMELFGVWKFPTTTNHQDLRAAARIALYGALKEDDMNSHLYTIAQKRLAINGITS